MRRLFCSIGRILGRLVFVLVFDMSFAPPASACTTFCYADGGTLVFGRNYDWMVGDGLVMVNRRDVTKRAFTRDAGAAWTSKYGSLTFNQYGREFPTGGMNEKGLVVELMWLDDTRYPGADERAALPTLQWIQYQLDNCATVDDVIRSDRDVRISNAGSAKIHFLVADADGGVAAIEFLGGKLVAHRGDALPYPVLTNDTYERSAAFARAAGPRSGRSSPSSLERFARAASHRAHATSPADAVRSAFTTLEDVAQGEYTRWSIVYDIGARRAYFRTSVAGEVRWIDAASLGFDCHRDTSMLDINAPLGGDVTARLEPYNGKANEALIEASFARTPMLAGATATERAALARYPESTVCAGASGSGGGK